ncbi:MAG: leucyl/phenylalanyl-tRNA--protein transferase [Deltaproteobacteria bacterium]|jgi:leucyl/phenylalanyl-tRNA---protein transferase|nr:leucyl/phenylalanyl-tRNA--protein transferase [Deltaproteobacteria bacterium]MBT4526864.1 leucyl/phenylalanyl-tRNA--protein transferase [Deltaproteobacteria bacterium]
MSIFQLGENLVFPDPRLAEPEGLLAFGGDLEPERILMAYKMGIFPWFSDNQPILWWSPDPRMVLFPEQFHISKTLRRRLRSKKFTVEFDRNFSEIIQYCAITPRHGEQGTWITDEMIEAYHKLHLLGFAHCVSVSIAGKLVGGLYGISIGKGFFGESMFSLEKDVSKIGFAYLAGVLNNWGFDIIDCQLPTDHLKTLGAVKIDRTAFLNMLSQITQNPTRQGNWREKAKIEIDNIVF